MVVSLNSRPAKQFRGGLVSMAHRWLYHSTIGSRVLKKKKRKTFDGTRSTCSKPSSRSTLSPTPTPSSSPLSSLPIFLYASLLPCVSSPSLSHPIALSLFLPPSLPASLPLVLFPTFDGTRSTGSKPSSRSTLSLTYLRVWGLGFRV